jgi:predicted phage-related endonuclease
MGLSPWKTPLQVYFEKIGEGSPYPDNPSMAWGRKMESVILDFYDEQHGIKMDRDVFLQKDFRSGRLDGRIPGLVIEAKTSRFKDGFGEPGTDEIPAMYIVQVQHYMWLADADRADIPILFGINDFQTFTVNRDEELIKAILEAEAKFWELVNKRIPPEPKALADYSLLFPKSTGKVIEATPEALEAAKKLAVLEESKKKLDEEADRQESLIKEAMKDAEIMKSNGITLATWKSSKGSARLDTERLKNESPETYKQYLKHSEGSRRFTIKKIAA